MHLQFLLCNIFSVKAPVLAHMSAILDGIPVIRAFKLEDYMLTGANRFIDRHTTAW